jgi:predicted MFS family arabinose efflux permease
MVVRQMNKPKIWTKDFIIVSAVNFCLALNYYLVMIVVSEFALNNFKVSTSQAGLTAGIFVFGALIGRFIVGIFSGRVGPKKLLFAGLILGVVSTSLYFAASNISLLMAIRVLHGMSFGIASTAAGTIVANLVPESRCGEGIGYYGLSVIIASAFGPFLGIFISQHASYNMIFIASTFVAVLSLVITFFLAVTKINLTEAQLRETKEFHLSNFVEVKVIPISIVCLVFFLCYSSIISFLTVYSKQINLVDAASVFYTIYAVAVFFSRPFVGKLFDKKGENLIVYAAILIFMTGMIVFSQAQNNFMLLSAAALVGLGFGALSTSGQAIAVKLSEPHRMGLATSTFLMFADTGMGIGPYLFGIVIAFSSYREMYISAAIVLAVSFFIYYILHGRKASHRNAQISSKL